MFWLQQQYAVFDELSETVCSCKQLYQGRSLAFKIRQNAYPAGAQPWTPSGELTMLLQAPYSDIASQIFSPRTAPVVTFFYSASALLPMQTVVIAR